MTFSTALRWTLACGTGGALLFVVSGVLRSLASGANPLANAEPLAAFAIIGGTVGGLLGPLIGGLVLGRRRRDS